MTYWPNVSGGTLSLTQSIRVAIYASTSRTVFHRHASTTTCRHYRARLPVWARRLHSRSVDARRHGNSASSRSDRAASWRDAYHTPTPTTAYTNNRIVSTHGHAHAHTSSADLFRVSRAKRSLFSSVFSFVRTIDYARLWRTWTEPEVCILE